MNNVNQAPSACELLPFQASEHLSLEDTLVHAAELLRCASATAYECGDGLKGGQRDLAFSVLHLVQMARTMIDRSLDRLPASS